MPPKHNEQSNANEPVHFFFQASVLEKIRKVFGLEVLFTVPNMNTGLLMHIMPDREML